MGKKIQLDDRSATGRKRPWKQHKKNNRKVIDALHILDNRDKAHKIADCCNVLEFGACPDGHGQWLKKAYFCKDRLCFICVWRKSLFIYHQFLIVAHKVLETCPKTAFLFLTLTVENCKPEDLPDAITHLIKSYRRFLAMKPIKAAFKGAFRTLEVTYNPLTNTFHPHLHIIVAVNPSYFTHGYLSQAEITLLWQKALKVDYTPICDVRRVRARKKGASTVLDEIRDMDTAIVKDHLAGAVAEIAKYAAKIADILFPTIHPSDSFEMKEAKLKLRADKQKQAEILGHLADGLRYRQLVAYTGVFRDAYKALKCKDVESSDLILMPGEEKVCDCPVCKSELATLHFVWDGKEYYKKNIAGGARR